MTIDIQANTIIFQDFDSNLDQLLVNLNRENLENKNIILDISKHRAIKPKDLSIFLSFAKNINKNKKSFVIVLSDFDFNKTTNKINIVPTIQEAHDIIELEEIERDLGF